MSTVLNSRVLTLNELTMVTGGHQSNQTLPEESSASFDSKPDDVKRRIEDLLDDETKPLSKRRCAILY